MPNFESSLTNRKFAAQPMRDLDIPDETGYNQQPPQQVRPVPQQAAQQNYTPMSDQELQAFRERLNNAQSDPGPNLSEIEREVKLAREQKARGQVPLAEGPRKRIEMLIGMTRLTRTVDIGGSTYVLRSLNGREMREAILAASAFDGTVQGPFEIRLQMLAHSLYMIAEIPVEQFLGTSQFEARLDFLEALDDALLNRLMSEYTSMSRECKEKYGLTTIDQVKEVAEDLKK